MEDHQPLLDALNNHRRVILFYCFEDIYWHLPDTSFRHWSFIYDSLKELKIQIADRGGDLLFRSGDCIDLFEELNTVYLVEAIYAHEETGNDWTYQRDRKVYAWCCKQGVSFNETPSNGVVRRLKSRDCWSKKHTKRMNEPVYPSPQDLSSTLLPLASDPMPSPVNFHDYCRECVVQKGGRAEAEHLLESFIQGRSADYLGNIANPSSEWTSSRLSPHIAYGTLSMKEIFSHLRQFKINSNKRAVSAFYARLHWRCHFVQKLEDAPEIEYTTMHRGFTSLRPREGIQKKLRAWLDGLTGYPIIDACMRCLHYTGWLPFRMRAMVVSFASYDLWLDFRDTAPVLAGLFTDYEPGIHYSQMQMQSGTTGINTLRMYNPMKQSEDHDPEGVFIKKYVPELKDFPIEYLHAPWEAPPLLLLAMGFQLGEDYPNPIVDHKKAIQFARKEMGKIQSSPGYKEECARVYELLGSRSKSRVHLKRRAKD